MVKILWRGKNKKTGEGHLKRYVKPADPNATIKKDPKDSEYYIIEGSAIISSKPIIVQK